MNGSSSARFPRSGGKPGLNEADPRVKRTRKLLQDALLELLTEKSFDAITVQEIAARSTVNRATFYAHFDDKHHLFAQFTREWFRRALSQRLAADAPLTRANLRLLVLVTMDVLAELHDHCRPAEALKPLIMCAVQEELSALLRGWLAPLSADGAGPCVALEPTVAGVSWAIFGAALNWSQASPRPPTEGTADQIAGLLTKGLATAVDPERS